MQAITGYCEKIGHNSQESSVNCQKAMNYKLLEHVSVIQLHSAQKWHLQI